MSRSWGSGNHVVAITIAAAAAGCTPGPGPTMRFVLSTPHENYAARLEQIGLNTTALGRDWLSAAQRSLSAPIDIDVPHREARYLDPARAVAVAYRVPLHQGQRVFVRVDAAHTDPARVQLFLDLFLRPDSTSPARLVASADSLAWELDYVALRSGEYVLRVQPELLRGGRVTLTVTVGASLGFPVAGRDVAAIRSRFGVPRDGGRRDHEGVDIFAPRGTPVVASVSGQISRAMNNRLGGKILWLRDTTLGRWLYYAHLDRHAVRPDTWVRAGDTLGYVGNTGNARTTPPHLHFGIYLRGSGAVDPFFHLYDPKREPPALADDAGLVPRWARVRGMDPVIRARPSADAPVLSRLRTFTPVEVVAGTGQWYFARTPDGREGYLDRLHAEPLAPTMMTGLMAAAMMRAAPSDSADDIDEMPSGGSVTVLGRFGDYLLVRNAGGLQGWIGASAVSAVAAHGPGAGGAGGAIALSAAPRP
jgi:murein DD-endopeptidase MepM/ murein hydrolase activator NlpD/SH3-like domain-containing protein